MFECDGNARVFAAISLEDIEPTSKFVGKLSRHFSEKFLGHEIVGASKLAEAPYDLRVKHDQLRALHRLKRIDERSLRQGRYCKQNLLPVHATTIAQTCGSY